MRFDNPIKKHKFKFFSDIAEFEEIKNEYRNNLNYDLTQIKKHLKNGDLNKFNKELDVIIKASAKEKKISKTEKIYQKKLRKKINSYFKDLYNNGGCIFSLDINGLIDNEIKNKINILKKRKDWRPPPGTFDKWIDLSKKFKKKLNNKLLENKIIEACKAYYSKKNMKVTHARLTLCKPTDNSWKQFLYDCKKITKHTNLHLDPLEGVLKIILNITKVNKNNGPTAFLPKSNRFIYDPIQSLFARAIAIGNYCHNPISRRAVFRLPSYLRVTTNFGRLIKNKSSTAKYLDKNLKFLTHEKGNCLLFDPGSTIHNGGVVKKKFRISIQIVIE